MKGKVKKIISCVLISVLALSSIGIYAAQAQYITEAEFAQKLNKSGYKKVAGQSVTGTNTPLTRERAAVLLSQYLSYNAIVKDLAQSSSYRDVQTSKGEIELVSQLGLMNGTGNGMFSPKSYITVQSAEAMLQSLGSKLMTGTSWKHACYAISSSSQMNWMSDYNAISFGWAQIEQNGNGFVVSTDSNSLKVPDGFENVVDMAKANGSETYLMIYFDGQGNKGQSLLNNSGATQELIAQMTTLVNGIQKNGATRGFDGITIDFEGLADANLKAPYVSFLNNLSQALKAQNKKLNVALQPTLYYKGYNYGGIGAVADHVILMAHDYGARTLSLSEQKAGTVTTPLTPIDDVYAALVEAKKAIADPSKIVLQFSFGSLQWQKQNGMVLNANAYTPSYDKIQARLAQPGTIVHFDNYYQSTFATYDANGINNTIWYEDTKSIQAKMELAKLLGITSFSYWRLGMIPEAIRGL